MSVAHQNDFLYPGNRPQIPRLQMYTHNFLKLITQLSSLLPNNLAPIQNTQYSNLTPALRIQLLVNSIIHAVCLLKQAQWGDIYLKATVPGTVSVQNPFKNKMCLNKSLVKRGRLCVYMYLYTYICILWYLGISFQYGNYFDMQYTQKTQTFSIEQKPTTQLPVSILTLTRLGSVTVKSCLRDGKGALKE